MGLWFWGVTCQMGILDREAGLALPVDRFCAHGCGDCEVVLGGLTAERVWFFCNDRGCALFFVRCPRMCAGFGAARLRGREGWGVWGEYFVGEAGRRRSFALRFAAFGGEGTPAGAVG